MENTLKPTFPLTLHEVESSQGAVKQKLSRKGVTSRKGAVAKNNRDAAGSEQPRLPGGWLLIESAPMDGTVIEVKNDCMEVPVEAKFGDFTSRITGKTYREWIVVSDPYTKYLKMAYGSLVCPSHWRPKKGNSA